MDAGRPGRAVRSGGRPAFRHALFRVGEERWLRYPRVHHLVMDGYGCHLPVRRTAEVHSALARGPRIDHDADPALYDEAALAAHQERFLHLLERLTGGGPHTRPLV